MNLKDMILNASQGGGEPTPSGGGAPGTAPTATPEVKGLLEKLAHANGGEGIKEVAKTIFAILSRVTEFAIPLYGMQTEEGKELTKIINSFNKLSGGKETTASISSMIQSLISILPADMQKINPSNLTDLLTKGSPEGGAPTNLPNPSTEGVAAQGGRPQGAVPQAGFQVTDGL